MILIYVTHPNEGHAVRITRTLMNENLIACGNIYPVRSLYPWEGKIMDETEYVSILKTAHQNIEAVKERIVTLHEYEVPCILAIHGDANDPYQQWINSCLGLIH